MKQRRLILQNAPKKTARLIWEESRTEEFALPAREQQETFMVAQKIDKSVRSLPGREIQKKKLSRTITVPRPDREHKDTFLAGIRFKRQENAAKSNVGRSL